MIKDKDIWNEIILPEKMSRDVAIWWEKENDISLLMNAIKQRYPVKYLVTDIEQYLVKTSIMRKSMVIDKMSLTDAKGVQLWYLQDISEMNKAWIIENVNDAIEIPCRYIKKEIAEAEKLYIYGAGEAGMRTLEIISGSDILVTGFLDSSKQKQGKIYKGKLIYNPDEVDKNCCIVISTGYYGEIYESLLSKGIDEKNIFIDYTNSLFGAVHIPFYEFPILKKNIEG